MDWLHPPGQQAPWLANAYVNPAQGVLGDTYRYYITYVDPDNDAPQSLTITVDDVAYNVLTLGGESNPADVDYTDGKEYYFDRTGAQLGYGDDDAHNYTFAAVESGSINYPASGDTILHWGPTVTDGNPPSVSVKTGDTTYPTDTLGPITAEISDAVGIAQAKLYYQDGDITGNWAWKTVDMHLSGNQTDPDEYTANIPAYSSSGVVYYFVRAWDFEDNMGNDGSMAAFDNYTVTIGGGDIPWGPNNLVTYRGSVMLDWDAPTGGDTPDGYYVYYDTDISDGFQYTTQVPASPVAHPTTQCTHVVFGDTNDYYYVVRSYNGAGENTTDPSNMAYKKTISLATTGINWNLLSLPYGTNYTKLADITDDCDYNYIGQVSVFNMSDQQWKNRVDLGGGFWWNDGGAAQIDINPGDAVLLISTGTPKDWKILYHDIPAWSHNLVSTGISWNLLSLPYHTNYTKLGDITDDVGHTYVSQVSVFNMTDQQWKNRVDLGGGFWWNDGGAARIDINPGDAVLMISTGTAYTFTPGRLPLV
jgi:hypothetical protein